MVLVDSETENAVLVGGEGENQRIRGCGSGEFGGEIAAVGDSDVGDGDVGVTGFAGSGAFTERGLVTVAEFFLLP